MRSFSKHHDAVVAHARRRAGPSPPMPTRQIRPQASILRAVALLELSSPCMPCFLHRAIPEPAPATASPRMVLANACGGQAFVTALRHPRQAARRSSELVAISLECRTYRVSTHPIYDMWGSDRSRRSDPDRNNRANLRAPRGGRASRQPRSKAGIPVLTPPSLADPPLFSADAVTSAISVANQTSRISRQHPRNARAESVRRAPDRWRSRARGIRLVPAARIRRAPTSARRAE